MPNRRPIGSLLDLTEILQMHALETCRLEHAKHGVSCEFV